MSANTMGAVVIAVAVVALFAIFGGGAMHGTGYGGGMTGGAGMGNAGMGGFGWTWIPGVLVIGVAAAMALGGFTRKP